MKEGSIAKQVMMKLLSDSDMYREKNPFEDSPQGGEFNPFEDMEEGGGEDKKEQEKSVPLPVLIPESESELEDGT